MEQDEFAALYPDINVEEREESEELLDRFLELAWEIWEGGESTSIPGLTADRSNPTIQGKVEENKPTNEAS